ncbi:hypothetical protein [Halothiobacillus sp.]|uniref:DUF7017 domain-containing protein n=1 Tax=Halothiobacillus sp. TaxID=1891311 RepID=UPI0026268DD5|nr:hypothetical protein [Halothiobacillus sp.]MDD4967480.1 hypothetical protein [Halothiobacillus sp.]
MNWQNVQALRKAGQIDQALKTAVEILVADPGDFKTRSQYEWLIFDRIKRIVDHMGEALKRSQQVNGQDVQDLMSWMREFYRQEPQKPGMVCSNILTQLAKVGQHLPQFLEIVRWIGPDGLSDEDCRPREYQGKTYPSLGMKVARTLCKWGTAHPDASEEQMKLVLEFAERFGDKAKLDDPIWLNWDMTIVLRQMGDFQRATELLAGVIKAKRNEFWVWAEAGRLYQSEQPELAVSCFCRALECSAEPKFLVRAHRELAALLAEQEEYVQASKEVALTINIREAEGWPIGREMEEMIASPWYDPSADGAEKPENFYAKHSNAALALCFDVVETLEANYLGSLVPSPPKDVRPGWKPKPLFRYATKDSKGQTWSLVSPRLKGLKAEVGAPLVVVVGSQNEDDRQTIVHVSARKDGQKWDCLESGIGVVTRETVAEKTTRILILDSGDEVNLNEPSGAAFHIGDGVRFGLARNPKNNRVDVFNVELCELSEKHFKRVKGQLRRNPKGFGFVEDAFVPPYLVERANPDAIEVTAIAVHAKNPAKGGYGWRVVGLD